MLTAGSWNKQQFDAAFGRSFLTHEEGLVVFKLNTEASYRQGVHNVAGELVLRDGMYASEADVLLRMQVSRHPHYHHSAWRWEGPF